MRKSLRTLQLDCLDLVQLHWYAPRGDWPGDAGGARALFSCSVSIGIAVAAEGTVAMGVQLEAECFPKCSAPGYDACVPRHACAPSSIRWDYSIPGMVDTAKSLADLQAKGLIKHVGLTNMVRGRNFPRG